MSHERTLVYKVSETNHLKWRKQCSLHRVFRGLEGGRALQGQTRSFGENRQNRRRKPGGRGEKSHASHRNRSLGEEFPAFLTAFSERSRRITVHSQQSKAPNLKRSGAFFYFYSSVSGLAISSISKSDSIPVILTTSLSIFLNSLFELLKWLTVVEREFPSFS